MYFFYQFVNYYVDILSLLIYIFKSVRLQKSGSFGFAEGLALCGGAKPNVPLVRLVKIIFKKVRVGKKIKHEAMGCRVGKKSAVKFICRPVVSIIDCQFNGCCVGLYACP